MGVSKVIRTTVFPVRQAATDNRLMTVQQILRTLHHHAEGLRCVKMAVDDGGFCTTDTSVGDSRDNYIANGHKLGRARLDTPVGGRYAYQIAETTNLWCRKILWRLGRFVGSSGAWRVSL
jgi:hypothetical protein